MVNIEVLFSECSLLKSLPDISKWFEISNKNIENNFFILKYKNFSIKFNPNIDDNIKKDLNLSYVFYNCESLETLPNISKWNIDNAISLKGMFYNCESLKSIPDISKWNTSNVIEMNEIFFGC